jgi:hypothetical protein
MVNEGELTTVVLSGGTVDVGVTRQNLELAQQRHMNSTAQAVNVNTTP